MYINTHICNIFICTCICVCVFAFHLLYIDVCSRGTLYCSWLRHYARSWEVAGSISDEAIEFFFSSYIILPAALGPGVYPSCNVN
jgi:hypothetical protein